jgi:AcrR family transcriptional regulator
MTKRRSSGAERVATTRDAQRETTRARIIEHTVGILEHGGEQAVKVGDIANDLGVSIGTLYHHFDDREGLIVAARMAQFEGLLKGDIDAFRAAVDASDTVEAYRKRIRKLVRTAQDPGRSRFRRLRAEIAAAAHHNPLLSEHLARVQSDCTRQFTEINRLAQSKGIGNPDVDPAAAALFTQALTLGLILDDINTVDPVDRRAWDHLTDLLYDLLLAED